MVDPFERVSPPAHGRTLTLQRCPEGWRVAELVYSPQPTLIPRSDWLSHSAAIARLAALRHEPQAGRDRTG
jgi:hypothetical protein